MHDSFIPHKTISSAELANFVAHDITNTLLMLHRETTVR